MLDLTSLWEGLVQCVNEFFNLIGIDFSFKGAELAFNRDENACLVVLYHQIKSYAFGGMPNASHVIASFDKVDNARGEIGKLKGFGLLLGNFHTKSIDTNRN